MPTPYVKKLAKEHHTTLQKVEKLWDKAKQLAKKAGHTESEGDDYYAYVTGILKRMMHEADAELASVECVATKQGLNFKDESGALYYLQPDGSWQKDGDHRSPGKTKEELEQMDIKTGETAAKQPPQKAARSKRAATKQPPAAKPRTKAKGANERKSSLEHLSTVRGALKKLAAHPKVQQYIAAKKLHEKLKTRVAAKKAGRTTNKAKEKMDKAKRVYNANKAKLSKKPVVKKAPAKKAAAKKPAAK